MANLVVYSMETELLVAIAVAVTVTVALAAAAAAASGTQNELNELFTNHAGLRRRNAGSTHIGAGKLATAFAAGVCSPPTKGGRLERGPSCAALGDNSSTSGTPTMAGAAMNYA